MKSANGGLRAGRFPSVEYDQHEAYVTVLGQFILTRLLEGAGLDPVEESLTRSPSPAQPYVSVLGPGSDYLF